VVAGAVALLSIVALTWWSTSRSSEQRSYFFALLPFAARDVAISPNGHTVAVIGHLESQRNDTIWLYEPGSQDAKAHANTEGANFPFWSADGKSIGFFADGKLKRLDLAGGPIQTLCDAHLWTRWDVESTRRYFIYWKRAPS
jgi:eukaryotic-like serine/threonine-protein kinase